MQSILHYLLLFGLVFAVVLICMLIYIKLAHRRTDSSPEERRRKSRYMEGAPSNLSGPDQG